MAVVQFVAHKKQAAFLRDTHDVVLACAGKRGGKSSAAAVKLIAMIQGNLAKGVEGDYLIVGPTYNLLRNGTIPTLLRYWPRSLGTYRKSESRIQLPNGKNGEEHYVFIVSADEPDRIEAFGVLAAWLDEAGQFQKEVWDKVMERLTTAPGTGAGKIIISTTPYGTLRSWLYKDLIERLHELPWVALHNWSTLDNPFIDHTAAERAKVTMDPQVYKRDFLGQYTQIEGLIYPDFDRQSEEFVVKPFAIPAHWPLFAGLDYGFTDPTVILILAKDPQAKVFYVVDEYYRTGQEVPKGRGQLADWQNFLTQARPSRVRQLLYDPSAVGVMTDLQRLTRMNMVAADNEVDQGIIRVNRLFKTGRLKFFNTCEKTISDVEGYVYDKREGHDGKPAHDCSHGPDALRYAFSKDTLGIFPELRRPDKLAAFNRNFTADGRFIPPKLTTTDIFDLKKPKKRSQKEKEPGECFEYKPKYDPFADPLEME